MKPIMSLSILLPAIKHNLKLCNRCTLATTASDKEIAQCYMELNVPLNSKQDVVRNAYLKLAKKYHPDSGSPEANIDKFCSIENAFRVLTKRNTGENIADEMEKIVFDIKHTAPQHRQYLSFEGMGHGTPSQRMKQWSQARAEKASQNVTEHRLQKALASEHSILKKGDWKSHDIKTKYGFDRLVEDLIQESISKGEFENLSGKGKPLRDQNRNPFLDFTSHKLNEVLINNGFTPEWITMNKNLDSDIKTFKEDIKADRRKLGPYPLSEDDQVKWNQICDKHQETAKCINNKINTFNIIVPLINKQKFHIDFDNICNDILKNEKCNEYILPTDISTKTNVAQTERLHQSDDLIAVFLKMVTEFFTDLLKSGNVNDNKKKL